MGAEDGEVYILRTDEEADADADEDEEAWVSPEPASEVILGAVAEAMETDVDDLDDLSEYVDRDELAAVFDGDADEDELTFEVEDQEVTVHASGDIDVADA